TPVDEHTDVVRSQVLGSEDELHRELAARAVEISALARRHYARLDAAGRYVSDADAQSDVRHPLRAGVEVVEAIYHEVVRRQAAGSPLGPSRGGYRAGAVVAIVVLELDPRAAEGIANLRPSGVAQIERDRVVVSGSVTIVGRKAASVTSRVGNVRCPRQA